MTLEQLLHFAPQAIPELERRLLRSVMKDRSGCWNWTGAKNPKGYGGFAFHGANVKAHRAAWTVWRGSIPSGIMVCHRCDNPSCCNPDHLFLGTSADNTHDAMKKGRFVFPKRPIGDLHPKASIDERKVRIIRRLSADDFSGRSIAQIIGCSTSVVYRVLSGKWWRHVQ